MTSSLSKTYKIKAGAKEVFGALTDQKLIAKWSGSAARMSPKPGSTFSLWGGSIHGRNESITPFRIMQQWKQKSWKEYSTVTFALKESGGVTTCSLSHKGIPATSLASIKKGWDEYYMLPLKKLAETAKPNPYFAPFLKMKGVTVSKMFGWDCLKVNGNVFLTSTADAFVVKLAPTDVESALKLKGATLFEPMKGGPKMKEWVSFSKPSPATVKNMGERAFKFVKSLPPKKVKSKS